MLLFKRTYLFLKIFNRTYGVTFHQCMQVSSRNWGSNFQEYLRLNKYLQNVLYVESI